MVEVKSCIVRDSAAARCDSLEIEFWNAAGWYSWGPEEDDQIVVMHDGYNSGTMYVNKILPENGKFRIFAGSLPCRARTKMHKSFSGKTIEEIMRHCAVISGMDFRTYGIDANTVIPYIEQNNEGCAAFLHRLLMLESAALKCVNGRYAAIGYGYANDLALAQTIELSASRDGVKYQRDGTMFKAVNIKTPYADAWAVDTAVSDKHSKLIISGTLPARNNIQAARWARGKLLSMNRKCESVVIQSDFNAGMTAMIRFNITGTTDATGEWLVEEVEHDIRNSKTTALMRRCIRTIR